MNRLFLNTLAEWNRHSGRKPLVVRGMRQTGKTWCVRAFADEFYKNRFLEVNFEYSDRWRSVFDGDLDPVRICEELEALSGKRIMGGDTLLFLDEIQMCPRALASLRYFHEQMPGMPVVAAGSLLDFVLADVSFPVGRVQFADLHPMSFAEYLEATDHASLAAVLREPPRRLPDALHAALLDEVRTYAIVGGLPECVKARADGAGLLDIREIQRSLVAALEQDFGKYPRQMDASTLRAVWRAANASVGRQIAYAALSREHTGPTNKKALDLLSKARLVRVSRAVSAPAIPFNLDTAPRIKLFSGDIGLYQTMAGRPVDETLLGRDLLAVYNGALAEQFVAQALAASFGGDEPHWWKRDAKNAQAEVDFMVALNGRALPIEVKSGAAGRLRSVHQFLKETPDSPPAVVFSSAPFGTMPEQRLCFVPIYYAGSLLQSASSPL